MAERTHILIVEDNPVDVRMICFALEDEASWETATTVVGDGEEAVDYLLEHAADVDLVILDLNLPKRDGTEVLRLIRSTERLASLPVIVLSSSPEDVIQGRVRALNLEANSYLSKPVGANEFLQLGQRLRECYRDVRAKLQRARASNAG